MVECNAHVVGTMRAPAQLAYERIARPVAKGRQHRINRFGHRKNPAMVVGPRQDSFCIAFQSVHSILLSQMECVGQDLLIF